jgi:hypothetical protein
VDNFVEKPCLKRLSGCRSDAMASDQIPGIDDDPNKIKSLREKRGTVAQRIHGEASKSARSAIL